MRPGSTITGELRVNDGAARARHFMLAPRTARAQAASTIGFRMAAGGLDSDHHRHPTAQLLYVVRGEVTCEAAGAWWIVPPGSALWVPGNVRHRVVARAPLEGYNVYLAPDRTQRMPAECCAVEVTPLLRELVLRLAAQPVTSDPRGPSGRLVGVLLDELATVSVTKHRLPMPADPRLRTLVARMTSDPADGAALATWGKRVGCAARTLNRLLVRETGLSFGRWRQQLHITLAIQRMARGASVQGVASDLGYKSASSFVTMFRKALGTSPARYMANRSYHRGPEAAGSGSVATASRGRSAARPAARARTSRRRASG